MAPVIGEALWRVKTDSLIEDGYKQAFAPGYDQADGFDDPDQTARDNDAMTYTSYTDSASASEDYEDESPLDARMRNVAVPLMVIFGTEDQIYDADRGARRRTPTCPGCARRRSTAPATRRTSRSRRRRRR